MKIKKQDLDKIKELDFYKRISRWIRLDPDNERLKLTKKGYIQRKAKELKNEKVHI